MLSLSKSTALCAHTAMASMSPVHSKKLYVSVCTSNRELKSHSQKATNEKRDKMRHTPLSHLSFCGTARDSRRAREVKDTEGWPLCVLCVGVWVCEYEQSRAERATRNKQ